MTEEDFSPQELDYYRTWFEPLIRRGRDYADICTVASQGNYRTISKRDLQAFLIVREQVRKGQKI